MTNERKKTVAFICGTHFADDSYNSIFDYARASYFYLDYSVNGQEIMQKPGCPRAENMWKQLKLNRGELMEQRREAIESVTNLVERYKSTIDPAIKAMLKKNILLEIGPNKQYSRFVKSAIEQMTNEKW